MLNLLFSPNGRIDSASFMKGAIILLALNFFLWLAWFINLPLALLAGLVSLMSIYCWACLFVKRFHDAGRTGWLFPAVLIAFLILAFTVMPIFVSLFLPVDAELANKAEEMRQIQEDVAGSSDPEDLRLMMSTMFELYQSIAMRQAIVFFLTGLLLAFGINKFLKTDPEPNRWG